MLLNHGAIFKQYHVREAKLPAKQPSKISAKVAETMAWKDGKRVGIGSKEYLRQHPVDPVRRGRRLHLVFGTGFCAPQSRSTAAASGAWPGGFSDLEELGMPCKQQHRCHDYRLNQSQKIKKMQC